MKKIRRNLIIKKYSIDILKIIIGTVLMAFAVDLFLLPNKLSSGGVTGIATILYYLFKFPIGITIFIINMPFFVIAYFKIGRELFIKTIIGTISFSIFLDLFGRYTALTTDRFLACIYGGVTIGLGTAIILKTKSSTGGTDLVTYIVRIFKPEYRTSNIIIIIDIAIVFLNVLFFREIEIGLYSAITIYLMGKIIDIIFEGIYFTKMVYIISDKYQKISNKINEEIKRGTTGLYGKGMYKDEEKMILLCVASRTEVIKIMQITKRIDSRAFIIISNAREVFGKGFKKENKI